MMTALLSVLVLGFLLGMRHATDPDHVVAVTTIVSHAQQEAEHEDAEERGHYG